MSIDGDSNHWHDDDYYDGHYYAEYNYLPTTVFEESRSAARTRSARPKAPTSKGRRPLSAYQRQLSNTGRETDAETTSSSSRTRGKHGARSRGNDGQGRGGHSRSINRAGKGRARNRWNDSVGRDGARSRGEDSEGGGGARSLWNNSEGRDGARSRGEDSEGRGRAQHRWNNREGRGGARNRWNNSEGRGGARSRGKDSEDRGGARSREDEGEGRDTGRGLGNYGRDGNNEESSYTRNNRNKENRRKRENPIGYKALESLLEKYSDEVVTKLQLERSGYDLLISNIEEITSDKMCLLLSVLHHASTAQVNRENLNALLVQTFKPHFIHRLLTFAVMIESEYSTDPEKMSTFFKDMSGVLQVYVHSMPTKAADQILPLVLTAIMVCERSATPECEQLVSELKYLKDVLENEKREMNLGNMKERRLTRQRWEENLAPPDNFRDIPVLPTDRDIHDLVHPFLRENKIKGFYKDAHHYLDVQFRLLREDFVRPLRNGIHEYKSQTHSKNMDVRIYENVKILGTDVANKEIIYYVQLQLRKNMNIENSKRLLYGNLVCFSADRFKTFVMGSVAERKIDKLKKGVLGVKFESDINKSLSFTMVESRAYFMAYKHVLCALQEITEDSFPLPEFIIQVHQGEIRPSYVTRRTFYDLQVLRHPKMMKESERYNQLFVPESHLNNFPSHGHRPHLDNVLVINNIEYWPTAAEMGFDESQRRALRSALTKKLAIIQGPPGTGKTFIGLKITQVLLHNSDAWKRRGQTPILVVCFTNHALDQFLEGIAEFTQSIVRVGSRTQSESISQFQINSLVLAAKRSRKIPYDVYEMNQNRHQDVLEAEAELKKWKRALEETENPQGILRANVFLKEKVVTENIALQMNGISLKSWLMDTALFERWQRKGIPKPRYEDLCSSSKTEENSDDDMWEDADELLTNEENDRMLYEGDSELRKSATPKQILDYEVNTHSLEQELSRMTSDNGTEFKDIQQEMIQKQRTQALKKELDILKSGFQTMLYNSTAALEGRESKLYLWDLDFQDRWLLYKILLSRISSKLKSKQEEAEQEFRRCSKAWEEIRCQEMLHVMRNASVVGMTTTGAAQNTALLRSLQPAIVIVEEAAEILEAHVITALSSRCEHLIMIGDHQQLQPSATVYDLARNFNLETSLFERMIKNDLPYDTLEYQHRMRPEISCLLVPSIYPTLKDHESVHKYPNVKGVAANVFIVSHTHYEDKIHSDDNSHQNEYEGNFIMALCRHLRLQGYSPDKITILTPYSGQYFLLKKLQRKYHVCERVKICIVDNFQGEENNIILLSLVRSNLKGQVGFLKKENRVCVALSRAQHGLYIVGNIDQLSAEAELWVNIQDTLKKNKAIGPSLTLRCENHREQLILVSSGEDFLIKSPEGGCMKPCSSLLSCGHRCPKTCHMTNLHHNDVKCPVPCPKMCKRNHPCRQKCWEKCDPCMEIIKKTLPCGHTHNVRCSKYERDDLKCPTIVERTLPACNHLVEMQCHRNPATFQCPVPCDIRLDCGHQCTRSCHTRDDPDHQTFKCSHPCTRSPEGCSKGHRCKKPCWEDCGPCNEFVKKMRSCGHWHTVKCHVKKEDIFCTEDCRKELSCKHPCPRKCSEPCGGCPVKVKKIVPDCRHVIQVECRQQPLRLMCKERCTLTLPCGHACTARCCETCTEKCLHRVRSTNKCPKGHEIFLPCYLRTNTGKDMWKFCNSPCDAVLNCEHPCTGNCGTCLHGRLHAPCGQKCQRSLPCGHVCKADCGTDCPPCQDACPLRCQHSRCTKRCGEPCNDCQEKCLRRCVHRQCKAICCKKCTVEPCEEPCSETLPCKHTCVGFCGDPCPPLCRICDKEELTEIFFGSEDEEDARFVLLEECGHVIEADGLKNWLSRDEGEISMKKCPRCQSPIYNNRRFKEYIKKTLENIQALKLKYYTQKQVIQKRDIEQILTDPNILENFQGEVEQIKLSIRQNPSNEKSGKVKYLSDAAMNLLKFQASVLQRLHKILHSHPNQSRYLKVESSFLLKRLMSQQLRISEQMMEEVTCELQRLSILPAVWKLYDRYKATKLQPLGKVVNSISEYLHASRKFDMETEAYIRKLLKEGEKFIGGLGVNNEERIMILKAMQLRQGHWYKCPNGHIYCITECGGAMMESRCPECGACIGGTSHALRRDNAVATEMDGARHAAWSEHANMANFDMGDLL